jgi:hypothetical protein
VGFFLSYHIKSKSLLSNKLVLQFFSKYGTTMPQKKTKKYLVKKLDCSKKEVHPNVQNRVTQYGLINYCMCEINFPSWKCEFKAWEQKGHPQFTLDIILIDESLEDEKWELSFNQTSLFSMPSLLCEDSLTKYKYSVKEQKSSSNLVIGI